MKYFKINLDYDDLWYARHIRGQSYYFKEKSNAIEFLKNLPDFISKNSEDPECNSLYSLFRINSVQMEDNHNTKYFYRINLSNLSIVVEDNIVYYSCDTDVSCFETKKIIKTVVVDGEEYSKEEFERVEVSTARMSDIGVLPEEFRFFKFKRPRLTIYVNEINMKFEDSND
jgi:YHS domain-containing protein